MAMNIKEISREVSLLARETGTFLVEQRRALHGLVSSQSKGVHDYVTQFDRESESRIVKQLKRMLPESGFIAEEGTAASKGGERYVWIVDPLDGTTNYIHGLAPTCVSIGLHDRQRSREAGRPVMVVGVVYEIWAEECFSACDGEEGAYLNGDEIRVSQVPTLNDSLIATGFPYTDFSRIVQYMKLLEWSMRNSHGVRRLGSAAADLVYTACGRCDAFFEYGLKPYDVAAGAYIVEKAGGSTGDFSGGANWLFGGEMVATNSFVYKELIMKMKEFGI